MSDAPAALLTSGAIVLILGGLVWIARRIRRRGVGAGYSLMGAFDEMWHPAALDARVEIQRHDERQAPDPSAGGPSNTQ